MKTKQVKCFFNALLCLSISSHAIQIKTMTFNGEISDLGEQKNRCVTLTFPKEPLYTVFISGSQDGTNYNLSVGGKVAHVITTKNDFSTVHDNHDYNFDQLARLNLEEKTPGLTSIDTAGKATVVSEEGSIFGKFLTVINAPKGVLLSGKIISIPYASFRNSPFNSFVVPKNLKTISAIESLSWTSQKFTYQEGNKQFSSILSVVLPKDNLPAIDFQTSKISMSIWNIDKLEVCFN